MDRAFRKLRRFARRPTVMTLFVLAVGLSLTFVGVQQTRVLQKRDEAASAKRRTNAVAASVRQEVERYQDMLRGTAVGLGSQRKLTAASFAAITAPLARSRLAGAANVLYVIPATNPQVPRAQAYWRRQGSDGLVLRPAGNASEHAFPVLGRSLDGDPLHLGIDITQLREPSEAIIESRRTDDVVLSHAFWAGTGRYSHLSEEELSLVMATPVHDPPDKYGRQGAFRGWALMTLGGGDLLKAVLADISQGLINVSLSAALANGRQAPLAQLRAGPAGPDRPVGEAFVPVGTRQWRLRVRPTDLDSQLTSPILDLATARAVAGMVLTALAAGLVLVLGASRERGLVLVDKATAEARLAEAEARRHSHLLQAVMDSISDGVNVVDQGGRYMLRNPAGRRLLGLSDNEDVAGPMDPRVRFQFFKPDGTTLFPAEELPLFRALAGESVDDVDMVIRSPSHPDQITITASSRPVMSGNDQIGAVVVFRDVTLQKQISAELGHTNEILSAELERRRVAEVELRRAMEDLADQKAYLTEVLDAIKIWVMTCDNEGRIVHRNLTGRLWVPYEGPLDLAEFARIVRFRDESGHQVTRERLPLYRALHGEPVTDQELTAQPADAEPRHLVVNTKPLHDATGAQVGAVSSAYDVTALREREAELRAFAGVVAHDLKGPLAAVVGHLEIVSDLLAADGQRQTDRMSRSVDRAAGAARRMTELINDLLDYVVARDATLKLEPTDLSTLIDSVVQERTAHLRATGDPNTPDIFCGPMPMVLADAHLLRQVIDNIVGNAVKYTRPGERARVDISAHHTPDGKVRIDIADRGIGIPPDECDKVFLAFHRAHRGAGYSGTGLGLPICKRIIERHGGEIGVTQNPGGGSRFFFTVPGIGRQAPPQLTERALTT